MATRRKATFSSSSSHLFIPIAQWRSETHLQRLLVSTTTNNLALAYDKNLGRLVTAGRCLTQHFREISGTTMWTATTVTDLDEPCGPNPERRQVCECDKGYKMAVTTSRLNPDNFDPHLYVSSVALHFRIRGITNFSFWARVPFTAVETRVELAYIPACNGGPISRRYSITEYSFRQYEDWAEAIDRVASYHRKDFGVSKRINAIFSLWQKVRELEASPIQLVEKSGLDGAFRPVVDGN
ncbi:uncharacterized protein CLUP02_05819 [Colletotrichum lupini]|uniref:Uncharacterized protein n=1 Tax=Colletotrichum lupini TaxID=145971 RepID=A0A9Q8SP21_9PEZI|nr:uncharacterized protein CLUP02_05819 [Colletotrichum lupini]UQC80336.1 hypothetical protein CLUP02_05819 [Colletotrichum lupini]